MRQVSSIASVALALAGSCAASAAEIEWLGTVNSDFHNPANWSGGAVPGVGDTAVINADAEIDARDEIQLDRLLIVLATELGVGPASELTVRVCR